MLCAILGFTRLAESPVCVSSAGRSTCKFIAPDNCENIFKPAYEFYFIYNGSKTACYEWEDIHFPVEPLNPRKKRTINCG